ncbi:alpha-2-macroglobulin [Haloferula helveola]|uniref:Alpha-2-macroglobulin n=2 Tax=Haloferula helveola TaxID=490095 RepID=A0ABM7RJF7_9BACT|nr:alpha-2-macroglobulin [Haloferula helveola]
MAADREKEWKAVEKALENDQPKTVVQLLEPIEKAAMAEKKWGEAGKAMVMRMLQQARIDGGTAKAVKAIDEAMATAPGELQPVLRVLSAEWLFRHYQQNRWRYMGRSEADDEGDDIEAWSLARILTEIDTRLQSALKDAEALKQMPAAELEGLLSKSTLGDGLRPTVFDFLSYEAAKFYSLGETAAAKPEDSFEILEDSPALGAVEDFLAWKPEPEDSPAVRAITLYQNLLTFHQEDEDPSAFLHADLERLSAAGSAMVGEKSDELYRKALEGFATAHAEHPESSRARWMLAQSLLGEDETKAAHDTTVAGRDAFPEHPFGKLCGNVAAQLERKEISLQTQTQWSPAGEEIRVSHRNLDRVWFRLYSLNFEPNERTISGDPMPNSKRFEEILKAKPVLEWDSELPDGGDYATRTTWLKAPEEFPTGYHMLVASSEEGFEMGKNAIARVPLHISPLALVVRRGAGAGVDGFVTDAVTGTPIKGIEVGAWSVRDNGKGTVSSKAVTGEDGYFRFKNANRQVLVMAKRDLERAVARAWSGGGERSKTRPYERIVFFTDRSIYRPGQTVHFKGVWCKSDPANGKYGAVAGRSGDAVMRDPNGEEVAKLKFKTNGNGSFSGSFTAPEGRVLGYYQIRAANGSGVARFRIEEYKRPKFFSEIEPAKNEAKLGGEVEVVAKAEAYTGAVVDGAKVTWRVTRQARWPDWIRWCWWYQPPSSGAEEIAHGEGETDAEGRFEIKFTAKPDLTVPEDTEPVFDYRVTVDITDGAGETRSATRTISVAYTTLRASIRAKDWLVSDEDIEFTLRTESHDGVARAAEGGVKIHRLEEPEVCPRPEYSGYGPRGEEESPHPSIDPDDWKLGEVVAEVPLKTEAGEGEKAGTATFKRKLEPGAYRLVFETKDANGRDVKAFRGIRVFDPEGDDYPTMQPFVVTAPTWTVEPGKEFQLLWGSGHEKARALVEFYSDGNLLKREWSAPGRTQQTFGFPIEESLRGGLTVVIQQVTMNRFHEETHPIEVPWTNKRLKLSWERIVSKLEPGVKETWTAVIEGADGEAAAAEMVATLYDASLDAFAPHGFGNLSGLLRRESGVWLGNQFSSSSRGFDMISQYPGIEWYRLKDPYREFAVGGGGFQSRRRNAWAFGDGGGGGGAVFARGGAVDATMLSEEMAFEAAPMAAMDMEGADGLANAAPGAAQGGMAKAKREGGASDDGGGGDADAPVPVRTNLNETAFFFPDLVSGEDGKVRISFTMPEALTTWRFLGMAHDKDLRSGLLDGETVTAKDLMVQPNPPRFLREGDELEFTVKISNLSDAVQKGTARLAIDDAATEASRNEALGIDAETRDFEVAAKQSKTLSWRVKVPDGEGFLRYRATASTGNLSDGEEGWLPVLSRRILVTESMSLPIRDAVTKDFRFDKLLDSGNSDSLENRFVHLQVVSQPAWYAVMALPYLMEFPHECSEQTFNRYYANALGQHIADSDPKIRRIFDLWKGTDTLDSPLLKNEDLKGIMIEETPWLADAKNESEARRRVGLLFDENHMSNELEKAMRKLNAMQLPNGLWPWFPGGSGSEYITLYITTGFGRLRDLGVPTDITPALKSLGALDAELTRVYHRISKEDLEKNHLSPWVAHHLYTRTLFLKDKALSKRDQVAFDYFAGQARENWTTLGSRMSRGHVAMALHRLGEKQVPGLITRSLKENATVDEEQGMFWKDAEGDGWWWWQAPIETQAMMIEVFREVDGDDKAVDDCQVWLIKQKQVADWKTTKATSDAVYALLMGGRDLLSSDALLQVSLGGEKVEPGKVEPGTGFYEQRFVADQVKPALGEIELVKTDKGVSWASLHWQYLEDMAKVTSHEGKQLRLEKQLFVRRNTEKGPVLEPVKGVLEVGDELVTRLVLRNDRAMEFVHLKDQRGSGTEPVNVLSGYRWQDGFGYYEMTRDTASHFFIDRLPPGTHVFETSVRIQHRGSYQTGIAEIRCMYAPEFAAHSASLQVEVK